MKDKFISKYWGYLFLLIPIILQVILFYLPTIRGVIFSFTNWTGLTDNYDYIGFKNYTAIFSDPKFIKTIKFTIIFTIGMILGQVTIGILVARALNAKLKTSNFFRGVFFFPAVIATVTIGMIFKQIFAYGIPLIGETLHIEFLKENLLSNPKTVVYAVLFVALWQGVATPTIIFLAGLQSIPQEILEAAAIDGASKRQIFKSIEIPFLIPSISMVFILALKGGLTAFDNIFVLTGGGPNDMTATLGMLVYNTAFKNNSFGYANALAVVLFIIIVVISLIQQAVSKKFEV